jgi:hypothetical protein
MRRRLTVVLMAVMMAVTMLVMSAAPAMAAKADDGTKLCKKAFSKKALSGDCVVPLPPPPEPPPIG